MWSWVRGFRVRILMCFGPRPARLPLGNRDSGEVVERREGREGGREGGKDRGREGGVEGGKG